MTHISPIIEFSKDDLPEPTWKQTEKFPQLSERKIQWPLTRSYTREVISIPLGKLRCLKSLWKFPCQWPNQNDRKIGITRVFVEEKVKVEEGKNSGLWDWVSLVVVVVSCKFKYVFLPVMLYPQGILSPTKRTTLCDLHHIKYALVGKKSIKFKKKYLAYDCNKKAFL